MVESSGLAKPKPNSAANAAAKRAVSHVNGIFMRINWGRVHRLVFVKTSSWIAFIIHADLHRGRKTTLGSQGTLQDFWHCWNKHALMRPSRYELLRRLCTDKGAAKEPQ